MPVSERDYVERVNFLAATYTPVDLAKRLVAQEDLREADAVRNDTAWRTMKGERDAALAEIDRLRQVLIVAGRTLSKAGWHDESQAVLDALNAS